tara:strand:- start:236 stop:931 length:696 start_codon:yes stop_codon:yes gene_type:complete
VGVDRVMFNRLNAYGSVNLSFTPDLKPINGSKYRLFKNSDNVNRELAEFRPSILDDGIYNSEYRGKCRGVYYTKNGIISVVEYWKVLHINYFSDQGELLWVQEMQGAQVNIREKSNRFQLRSDEEGMNNNFIAKIVGDNFYLFTPMMEVKNRKKKWAWNYPLTVAKINYVTTKKSSYENISDAINSTLIKGNVGQNVFSIQLLNNNKMVISEGDFNGKKWKKGYLAKITFN